MQLVEQRPRYSRREVSQHSTKDDCWVILHGEVYDVTSWLSKHPGGAKILLNHAGEDASVAWTSLHTDKDLVSKYMKTYHIGTLLDEEKEHPKIIQDFLKLRKEFEEMGLFEASALFNILMCVHAIVLEVLAWCILYYFGCTWITFIVSGVIFSAALMQHGFLQHELVHGSVFKSPKWNWFFNYVNLGIIQGVPIDWWDGRHQLHHAKPNVIDKDPDISFPFNFFLLGNTKPKEWGEKHRGLLPYQFQHIYFLITGPTFGITFFFPAEFIVQALVNARWKDLLLMSGFFVRFYLLFSPLFDHNILVLICWFFFIRFLESQWFVWVSQMNHIPMHVEPESNMDWVSMQLSGTCNVESSLFMDWFTGHLDFQIEHHLFPTMPRINYKKIQPRVKEFCQEHGLVYEEKGFWQGVCDIITALKKSGQLWADSWDRKGSKIQ